MMKTHQINSVRQPLGDLRFLWDLSGHFYFAIDYYSGGHEDAILGDLLYVLNIFRFCVQPLLLYYVLNQVVEVVAFGSACTQDFYFLHQILLVAFGLEYYIKQVPYANDSDCHYPDKDSY